jgi:hypothetical protein
VTKSSSPSKFIFFFLWGYSGIAQKCVGGGGGMIENEYHFLLVCPAFLHLRKQFLSLYLCHQPSLPKFVLLMSSVSHITQNKLATLVYVTPLSMLFIYGLIKYCIVLYCIVLVYHSFNLRQLILCDVGYTLPWNAYLIPKSTLMHPILPRVLQVKTLCFPQ